MLHLEHGGVVALKPYGDRRALHTLVARGELGDADGIVTAIVVFMVRPVA